MRFNKPYRTFPLRTTLVVSVVATAAIVVLICLGIVGYPAYSKAKKEIHTLWKDIANQVVLNAREQVVAYFQNAPATLKIVEGLVEEEQLSLSTSEALFDICHRMLKENPEFLNAYYFQADGTFYGILRNEKGFLATYRVIGADGKTKVENFRIGPENHWVLSEEIIDTYDPRKRPFWSGAVAHPEGAWSEPYSFAETGAKGFTYALAQKKGKEIRGYWAVDFEIDQLGDFLRSLKVGREGVVYIVDKTGTTIAASSSKDSSALRRYLQFPAASSQRIFSTLDLPQELGIPWGIITSIHEDDFLKPIRSDAIHSLEIGLLLSLFFLIATAIFFGKVSKRLKEIAWEMDEVGNFIFKPREADQRISRIREINAMNHALHKMRIGLQSFAKYIPLDVVKQLIFSGRAAKLGAEKKTVVVLFADMAHFTTLSETQAPAQVVQILEEFLTGVSEEVDMEKGIIDKFIGDAAMALWGAPQSISDPEMAACRAALKMKKRFEANARMDHRIGINSGSAMVGNFGSTKRLDYTAIGDAINIAARLEKLNKAYGTQILVGPAIAEAVKGTFLVRPLDSVQLEGRTQPLMVYELLGYKNEIPESIHQAVAVYAKALDAYLEKRFKEAAPLFEEANQLFGGNDSSSKLLGNRSLTL